MAGSESDLPFLTIILLLTACLVSLLVVGQVTATYTSAYLSAPSEITTFIDAVDFSIQENESYDKDVAKVQRLEDKLRMGKLLREIQKCGDDLREDLNLLLVDEGGTRIRAGSRLLWAHRRKRLEERMRRLDLLRMRFLVVYMGLVAAKGTPEKEERILDKSPIPKAPGRPPILHSITEGHAGRPPLRRLTTQAMGHNEHTGSPQKVSWTNLITELQNSPLLHKRRESIENAISKSG